MLQYDDVIIQWMIRWTAMMVSRYMVGKVGRTSYERRRGRACRVPVATFGEKVWYKQIREQKERKDKIESEWHEGLWLGQSRSTNETIVGIAEGVVRAYATRRQDGDERWKGDVIKKHQGTPARPDPNRRQLMIPIRVRFDPPLVGEPDPTMQPRKEPQMRRMKITESMLQKYQSCRHDSEAVGNE